jgi:CheY-like chemotaxis protein
LNSGQTLLALLNDILDLSKVEAGKLELKRGAFDPSQITDEITALFSEPARSKGIELSTAWRGPVRQRYWSDPIRLRQMLSNLVSNAIKFTDRGSVRVEVAEVQRDGNEAVLEFSVADTGIGVAIDKQSLLFKPFSQADSSTTREYGGTGLGLSIVRNLAKLMGGDVGIDSEAGKGSRFHFRVRVNIVQVGEESRHGRRATGTVRNTAAPAQWSGRVLVAEDNPTNRKVIEAVLRKLGIKAEVVENGQGAVDALTPGMRPDLVLMDLQMPVMDGLAATKRIRETELDQKLSRLPIIALTAGAFDDDRQNCLDSGMDDFLTKPIELKDLLSILSRWMPEKKTLDEKKSTEALQLAEA